MTLHPPRSRLRNDLLLVGPDVICDPGIHRVQPLGLSLGPRHTGKKQ